MRVFIIIIGLALLGFNTVAQERVYCRLQGSIFETPTKQGADFWVYEEESEAFADMLIFEEENKLYADQPGIWFFVDNIGLANVTIYFTKEKGEADFLVYFTDSPTFAGCK